MISKRRGSSSKGAINKKKTKLGKKVVLIKLEIHHVLGTKIQIYMKFIN
jgi:hypothetical protein